MKCNLNFLVLFFGIFFQSYSQQSNTFENENIKYLLFKIDSIQNNKPDNVEEYKFQMGHLYYDLFAEEFDWYGGEDFNKTLAKDWFDKAIIFLEESSIQGYWNAQHSLGEIYSNTPNYNGDPNNYNDGEKAIYWFSKAAEHEKPESFYQLALVYYTGNGGNESVKNDNKAVFWLTKAALADYGAAQSELGDIYYNGEILPQDYETAFFWYRKANEKGFDWSKVGKMYYYGEGTPQNYVKAFEMFKKSYDSYPLEDKTYNDHTACFYQGIMYYYGDYLEKDLKKAFKLIEQAAMIGNSKARALLGYMHYYGEGTLIDKKLAFTWLKWGATAGNYSQAQYLLGKMYFYGEVSSIDKESAALWMNAAFKNGSDEAKDFWDKNELWRYRK